MNLDNIEAGLHRIARGVSPGRGHGSAFGRGQLPWRQPARRDRLGRRSDRLPDFCARLEAAIGTTNVGLRVTDNGGKTSTATLPVTVNSGGVSNYGDTVPDTAPGTPKTGPLTAVAGLAPLLSAKVGPAVSPMRQ